MSWHEKNGTVGFAALLVLTDMAHQIFSFPAHGAEVATTCSGMACENAETGRLRR